MGKTISFYRVAVAGLLGLAFQGGAQAQGAIYKCVDEQGRVEFTDQHRRGCKQLESFISTVPSPVRASAPIPAVRPSSPAAAPAAAASPSSFPRVDTAQQRERDDERREILNDELRAEQKKLLELRRDFNNGEPERQGNERNYAKYLERVASMRDEIGRTERNIEALRREISNIR
jgi:HAMP domain-containing protein